MEDSNSYFREDKFVDVIVSSIMLGIEEGKVSTCVFHRNLRKDRRYKGVTAIDCWDALEGLKNAGCISIEHREIVPSQKLIDEWNEFKKSPEDSEGLT